MEILLLEDIPGVGKKNDLLMVGDGYALNCLLPKRKALVATPTVRKRYAEVIRRRAVEKQMEMQTKQSAVAAASGKTISFTRKATKTGKLYAAITEKNIVDALKAQHEIAIEEAAIAVKEPIKALGEFKIGVELAGRKEDLIVQVNQEKN